MVFVSKDVVTVNQELGLVPIVQGLIALLHVVLISVIVEPAVVAVRKGVRAMAIASRDTVIVTKDGVGRK